MISDVFAWGLLLLGVLMIVLPLARLLEGPDEERMSREWRERERGRR